MFDRGLPRILHRLDSVGFVHEDYPLVYTAGSTSEGIANAKSNHAFNAVLRERSRLQSFDHSSFFEMLERLAPSARYHLCTSFCSPAHLAISVFCVSLPLANPQRGAKAKRNDSKKRKEPAQGSRGRQAKSKKQMVLAAVEPDSEGTSHRGRAGRRRTTHNYAAMQKR